MAVEDSSRSSTALGIAETLERMGRAAFDGVRECGYAAALFFESVYWLIAGRRWRQPVRLSRIASEMMEIGVRAIPIVSVLSVTIGVMLAIQGIHTLRLFGAESRVTIGIALSITREFAPLITGILVAGRSGSALAARLGTMNINQEIDALRVMGINPVRFLVAPSLVAMMIMVPALTFWADLVGLLGAGVYVGIDLGMSMAAYTDRVLEVLTVDDLMHGLGKSIIFAAIITLVAVVNGASVSGGAEGVGHATTRSVVQAIAAILITDMVFVFIVTTDMVAAPSSSDVVEVANLVTHYGNRQILKDVSVNVKEGEIFVIMGGSGSGKSTLLRFMMALSRPTAGSIHVLGRDVVNASRSEMYELRKKMGVAFQSGALFSSMSVGENIMLPLREHTDLDETTIQIMARLKLEVVELAGFEHLMPSELSGGMLKRAAFARAVVMDPSLLFCDEPSAGLDPVVAAAIDELILRLRDALRMTVVVVTHELDSAFKIADRIAVLDKGEILIVGTVDEVRASSDIRVQNLLNRRVEEEELDPEAYLRRLMGSQGA